MQGAGEQSEQGAQKEKELRVSANSGREASPLSEDSAELDSSTATGEAGAELLRLRRKLSNLEAENERLRVAKEHSEEVLELVMSSRSWRLTSGLRAIALSLRALFPILRLSKRQLIPQAGRNTEQEASGTCFKLVGTSPTIKLECNGTIPEGWALFHSVLGSEKGHQHFYLYWDEGGGFQSDRRALIPLEVSSDKPVLLRLPAGVKGLRLDPIDTSGSFELSEIYLKPLGSLQLLAFFFRKHVLSLMTNPRALLVRLKKAIALFRNGGWAALRVRLFQDQYSQNYQEWLQRYYQLTATDREQAKDYGESLAFRPLISVVMPTFNTPAVYLRAAIESVISQLYENWELCIADDCSTDPEVKEILEEYAKKDSRIKFTVRETNGHISKASNSALDLASGEFVSLLDHDDELQPQALLRVASELNKNRSARFLYSDEDKITAEGFRFNPYFKSGFNPVLLLVQNYVCHLSTFEKKLIDEIGGFREGVEGAQDWDLILRATEGLSSEEIVHIPEVLYSWRVIEGSTAQATGYKPYVMNAQKKAVSEHLSRTGRSAAEVRIREDISQLEVEFPIPANPPLVSLIIPTRDRLSLVKQCVESIQTETSYRNFEIILVDNGSCEDETLEYFKAASERYDNFRVLRDDGDFNFSRLNNLAAREARGELLGLINNDLEVINEHWLREMVSYAVQAQIGAVGARLLYPNGLLQHGGVILGIGGVAGHNHKGLQRHDPGYFNRAILPQNLSAVTAACLVIRKEIFEQVEGLDEGTLSVAFNDVDFCLKVRAAGFENVYLPQAELFHHESASRGYETTPEKFQRFESEIEAMQKRWGDLLTNDPYYNPNLSLISEDFSLGFPPRVKPCWKE